MTGTDFQIVKTPSVFKVIKEIDDPRFMGVRIAVMHSGENLNKFSFETKVIRDAKDTFANIPVLANVIRYVDADGNERLDYGGHDAHIEEDAFNEGEYRLIYDEAVVGVVPETNNFEIIHNDKTDRDYVYVDALIYREYGNYVADILEARGGRTDVSAEIYTEEISFDAANQVIIVNKMRMAGITLLGEDVTPAMQGANASVFSIKEDDLQAQMLKVMSELNESLKTYMAAAQGEQLREGGKEANMKFEELLEKYGKTVEDITFEYDGLTDEELEAAFASAFETENEGEAEGATEGDDGESEAEGDNGESEAEGDDGSEENPEQEQEPEQNFAKATINMNGEVHEFSVSLQDKISALYELVNNTYGDEDSTWYDVTVYDDEKYVIMVDWWTGKGYKQSYKVKKDVYTLVGDRVEVYSRWLTQDEINSLDKMKADYAVMEEKLTHYEEEPQKLEILNSEDYSLIVDNEEFVALCDQENHFNMSIEEMTAKADAILTAAAKQHKFSVNTTDNQPTTPVRPMPTQKKRAKKYGSLFDGIM